MLLGCSGGTGLVLQVSRSPSSEKRQISVVTTVITVISNFKLVWLLLLSWYLLSCWWSLLLLLLMLLSLLILVVLWCCHFWAAGDQSWLSERRRWQPQKQMLLMAVVHFSCMSEQQLRYSLAPHTVVGIHKAVPLPCCFRSFHAILLMLMRSVGVMKNFDVTCCCATHRGKEKWLCSFFQQAILLKHAC